MVSHNDTKRAIAPRVRTELHWYAVVAYFAILAGSDLTMRTKGTLPMKMVGDFVSSKLHSQPQ